MRDIAPARRLPPTPADSRRLPPTCGDFPIDRDIQIDGKGACPVSLPRDAAAPSSRWIPHRWRDRIVDYSRRRDRPSKVERVATVVIIKLAGLIGRSSLSFYATGRPLGSNAAGFTRWRTSAPRRDR